MYLWKEVVVRYVIRDYRGKLIKVGGISNGRSNNIDKRSKRSIYYGIKEDIYWRR